MNKRVFISMLVLTITFLVGLYVLKIFFPNEFVMVIENERLIAIGEFIDNHIAIDFILGVILGIIFDYLYFGAVCRKLKLNFKLILIIIVYNIIYNSLYTFLPANIISEYSSIFVIASTIYMILLPTLFTKELLPLSITYTINSISQLLSLSIRNLNILLTTSNFMTMFLMTIETYLWLVLCLIIFNYKEKENKENGMG